MIKKGRFVIFFPFLDVYRILIFGITEKILDSELDIFYNTEEIQEIRMAMKFLSRQEELMLLSIWKLDENAYGVTIRKKVTDLTGKYWSIGAVYDVLDRLTRKGLVSTVVGDPIKARGGKSKRFYRITRSGFKALEEVRTLQQKAWVDLPEPVLGKK